MRRSPAKRRESSRFILAIVLLAIAYAAPKAQAEEAPRSRPATDVVTADSDDRRGPFGLRYYWKDTLRAESPDGNVKLRFGGRFMGDWAVFDTRHGIEDDIADFEEGTEVRRARIYYSGTLYDHFEFKTQISLADRKIEAVDVFVGLINIPILGGVRVGHFKEPFGLEELTSSRYITFLERSSPIVAFAADRNAGVMVRNAILDDRLTWAAGVFRDTDRFFDGEFNRGLHVTGRLTGLPLYEDGGRRLLHLGVAYSHRDLGASTARFRARPEVHIAPRIVDTGGMVANAVDLLGAEVAWVHGPFSLQGEYFHAFVNRHYGHDLEFNGLYVQASYFLTGEHRAYKKRSAAFDKITPARNFGDNGGLGAWQLAARYSYFDLNDADIRGGRTNNLTVGLNWHLSRNMRISWNYVYADPTESDIAHIFQTRLQFSF